MVKLGKSNLQKEEDERREKVLSPSGMLRDPRWG